MNKKSIRVCMIALAMQLQIVPFSFAQESILDAGIRIQKTVNFYFENGVSFQYSNKNLQADKLYFGFSYVTSRLGTAMNSNAIPQNNYLLSSAWYFRPQHIFRPLLRLNMGYFYASYGDDVFDDLPNSSFLLSPEFGASFETKLPLKFMLTCGYNLISGDGQTGAGTIYPLFIQTTVSWDILKK